MGKDGAFTLFDPKISEGELNRQEQIEFLDLLADHQNTELSRFFTKNGITNLSQIATPTEIFNPCLIKFTIKYG